MSAHCARMAKIGGQMRQFGLYVHTLGVPVLQHQNSATVPKIMKTRRVPLGIEDLGADTKPMPKDHHIIDIIDFRGMTPTPHQESLRSHRELLLLSFV